MADVRSETAVGPWVKSAEKSSVLTSWCMSSNVTYFYTDGHFWVAAPDEQAKLIENPILDGAAIKAKWHPLLEAPGDNLYKTWFLREVVPTPEMFEHLIQEQGTKEWAEHLSSLGVAYRLKVNGLKMFWDGERFWNQKEDGVVTPFKGVTVRLVEDWRPLIGGSPEQKLFDEKFGPTPMSIDGNWMDWTSAIGASPVNTAIRRDAEGKLWVRRSKDQTWIYSTIGHQLVIEPQSGFRHMNHWTPMPEDHPLAKADWNSNSIPYRDPKFPPSWCPSEEVDEWVATGTCPTDQKLRAERDAERAKESEEDQRIKAKKAEFYRKVDKPVNTDIIPKANDEDDHVYIDRPEPEVLANLIPLVEALASTTKMMVEIGDKETASALGKQVGYLVGGASWHLRNNRTEHARRRKS